MLAGPNGAGKTTFYREFLATSTLPFLNADEFEARTGVASLEAARILDAVRDDMVARGAGFITETVFSDPVGSKLGLLRRAVDAGYFVAMIYVGVDAELSALRIDQRVAAGGHDVPRDRIASRFERSLANLREAIRFVTLAKIYDNSSLDEPYRLLAQFESGKRSLVVKPLPPWAKWLARHRS
jgi:predicted ABC-type ATPase